VALRERHVFGLRWYHSSDCLEIAILYYLALRKVIKRCPELRKILCRCRHCQIFFFTEPCNQGRNDLGCPFGCAHEHRRSAAKSRSKEYYDSQEGKEKKKNSNKNRSLNTTSEKKIESKIEFDLNILNSNQVCKFISYLHFIMTQVENLKVSINEVQNIYQAILKIVRQHSLEYLEKIIQDPDG
jgi:hypothetical protein